VHPLQRLALIFSVNLKVVRYIILSFILLALWPARSGAQNSLSAPEVNWGGLQKVSGKDFFDFIVHGDTNGIYVLRSKYTSLGERYYYLDFFAAGEYEKKYTAELVGRETYKGTQARFKTYFENIFRINDKLVLFLSSYDHEKDRHYAYAQYLDDAGAPVGELVQVSEMKADRKSNRGQFIFTVSPGGQYILVIGNEPFDQKYNDEKFNITLLDSSLATVWSEAYVMPYKEQDFIPLDYQVDDNGNVYFLSKVYLSKEQQKERDLTSAEYYYTLLRLTPGDSSRPYEETIFGLEDKYIVNMVFRFDRNNDLRLAGYCAQRKDMTKVSGIYSMTIPAGTTQAEKISLYELEAGFVPDFPTEAPMRFGEDGNPELELTHYILLDDGSTILVGEHTMISEVCFTDFRTALTTCNYSYYYNDIFVVKIDRDGKVLWKIRVPKRQLTRNDYGAYSSFALGLVNGKIVIVYNENPKNLSIKNSNAWSFMTDPGRSSVVMVEIDPSGHAQKQTLFSNIKRRAWFRPRLHYQFDRKSMVLFSHRVRIYQFGELR